MYEFRYTYIRIYAYSLDRFVMPAPLGHLLTLADSKSRPTRKPRNKVKNTYAIQRGSKYDGNI